MGHAIIVINLHIWQGIASTHTEFKKEEEEAEGTRLSSPLEVLEVVIGEEIDQKNFSDKNFNDIRIGYE